MDFTYNKPILLKIFIYIILTLTIIYSVLFINYNKVYAKDIYKAKNADEKEDIPYDTDSPTLVSSNKEKYVYLTFDDGPDPKTTPKILDTLKKENIKATFFVIGQNITYYKKTFNRIVSEGHALGLHSYTHDLKSVYKSDEAFLNEMQKSQDLINKLTGKEVSILRFPGGTFKRMTPELKNKLHLKNYKIYDWHTSVDDGMKPRTPSDTLVQNAISYKGNQSSIIVLLHNRPNNSTTAEALPKLIQHYKSKGYKFKTISKDTLEYYFYCK